MPVMKSAFTLIELLIVVGIIAILAAIAVPNFLEAQVRAKVSRCKADMRTLATAIESYTVDCNKPPTALKTGDARTLCWQSVFHQDLTDAVSPRLIRLTTPIPYITAVLADPFVKKTCENAPQCDTYDYISAWDFTADLDTTHKRGASITSGAGWRLASAGPDRRQYYGGSYEGFSILYNSMGVDYDPTNGTLSTGDIVHIGGGPGPIYAKRPSIDRINNKYNGIF